MKFTSKRVTTQTTFGGIIYRCTVLQDCAEFSNKLIKINMKNTDILIYSSPATSSLDDHLKMIYSHLQLLAVLKSVRSIAKKSINVKFTFKFYQKNITATSSTVLTK